MLNNIKILHYSMFGIMPNLMLHIVLIMVVSSQYVENNSFQVYILIT